MSELSKQPCIMKCTNAVQMYLAVINEMYSTTQSSIMKCTKALQMYLAVLDVINNGCLIKNL